MIGSKSKESFTMFKRLFYRKPVESAPVVKNPYRIVKLYKLRDTTFYLDGQVHTGGKTSYRLVDCKTGQTVVVSRQVFEFLFEPKEK